MPDPVPEPNCAQDAERQIEAVARDLASLGSMAAEEAKNGLQAIAAAAVAHEVRNALTPVRARLELALLAPNDTAVIERTVKEALRGVMRASRAADAVLAVVHGRTASGEASDVRSVVDAATESVRAMQVRIEGSAGLHVQIPPAALEQVLVNLFLNARANSQNSLVYVRYYAYKTDRIVIEVQDQGPGIAPGVFGQALTGHAKPGSIGLVICRHLVEAVGGSIDAQSEPGRGTTVRLNLPRAEQAQRAAA